MKSSMTMILTGDVNLIGVDDPGVPFRRVADTLRASDIVFGNLECCLYQPSEARIMMADDISGYEGFYVPPAAGQALRLAGFHAVGNANNQNYGAEAIVASNRYLDELGIAHAGTGANRTAARAPVVLERKGLKAGFIQRTSQYWPNNHEAGEHFPGVAAMKAYTAYQPPYHKDGKIPPNRPGAPAKVVTWTDPDYLSQLKEDVASLKSQADVVVSSHHWGYGEEILQYQTELAHAAVDAGADVVMGHGPHFPLAIEVYQGKPIFYGLGSFCFIRSNKKQHKNWVGMIAHITIKNREISEVACSLVRQNDATEVMIRSAQDEPDAVARIVTLSEKFRTELRPAGDEVRVVCGRTG